MANVVDGVTRPIEQALSLGPACFLEGRRVAEKMVAGCEAAAGDVGKNIAVAVWTGGASPSAATQLTVVEFNQVYETGATPLKLDYLNDAGTLQFGESRSTLGIIPEPSSALLLALGGLGFLVRRKR